MTKKSKPLTAAEKRKWAKMRREGYSIGDAIKRRNK